MFSFQESSVAQRKLPQKYKELVLGNYFCAIGSYSECFSYFLKDYKTNTYAGFMIGKRFYDIKDILIIYN